MPGAELGPTGIAERWSMPQAHFVAEWEKSLSLMARLCPHLLAMHHYLGRALLPLPNYVGRTA